MLDFNHDHDTQESRLRRRSRTARRQSWRVWTLLLALGLVVLAMRQLNQPETAERLGQLFAVPKEASTTEPEQAPHFDAAAEGPSVPADIEPRSESSGTTATEKSDSTNSEAGDPLAKVRDNTYFRPDETDAWFGLFAKLQTASETSMSTASLGELSYAQLVKQPDVYRGKVVTIKGTVRREELKTAPANQLGIKKYHRLWIEPVGGGNWPIVVYCLSLPEDFPRGDKLKAAVTVNGYYFKNWSYRWDEGLGIAPVVLSRSVEWNTNATPRLPSPVSNRSWWQAIAIASAMAAVVVYIAMRTTRRPRFSAASGREVQLPNAETPTESVRDQLGQLAEQESQP